jgi:hypothetical protein
MQTKFSVVSELMADNVEELRTVIETVGRPTPKMWLGKGDIALEADQAFVMLGGNRSLRDAIGPYADCGLTANSTLSLFIYKAAKLVGVAPTIVMIKPRSAKHPFHKFEVVRKVDESENTAPGKSKTPRITMKKVSEKLAERYKA